MSDHDSLPPETDDEIRSRLRAFATEVKERTDTESALQHMPRRSLPPSTRLLAIAACVLAIVALAVSLADEPDPVATVDQPQTTECPTTTPRRTITSGGQMNMRFTGPVARAATAIMLIGACSDDDGPTIVAKGEDVEFVGNDGFAGQTLTIDVVEQNGELTGEFSVSDVVFVRVECWNTDTDGIVTVGGTITKGDPTHLGDAGDRLAVTIWAGDPDRVALGGDDVGARSCTELLESYRDDPRTYDYVDVEEGSDIETA